MGTTNPEQNYKLVLAITLPSGEIFQIKNTLSPQAILSLDEDNFAHLMKPYLRELYLQAVICGKTY